MDTDKEVLHLRPLKLVELSWVGTEVGVGTGDMVLDGDPAPHGNGNSSPHFSAYDYCGQMAGWIKMPLGSWYRGSLGPGDIMLDGDPSPSRKGAQQPPST